MFIGLNDLATLSINENYSIIPEEIVDELAKIK